MDAAADEETIKQSYRRMQMRWHPDIAGKAGALSRERAQEVIPFSTRLFTKKGTVLSLQARRCLRS